MNNDRVFQIDYMKAFGIYLVVLAHCALLSESAEEYQFVSWIYSFHMPVFFVVSGIGFGLKYDKKRIETTENREFIIRSIKHLFVPYIVWSLIYITVDFVYNVKNLDEAFYQLCERLYATLSFRGIAPLWFLIALLLAEILFWLNMKTLVKKKVSIKYVCGIEIVMLGIISIILWILLIKHPIDNPIINYPTITLIRTPLIMYYIWIGYFLGRKWKSLVRYSITKKVSCFIASITLLSMLQPFVAGANMHTFTFGNLPVFLITGTIGSVMILFLSLIIPYEIRCISKLGMSSMDIMIIHYPPIPTIATINWICEKMNIKILLEVEALVIVIFITLFSTFRKKIRKIVNA